MRIHFLFLLPLFLIRSATPCCGTDFFTPHGLTARDSFANPVDSMALFDLDTIDFGVLKMGELLSLQLSFTNIGWEPMEIEVVSACDCMEVTWTKEPIAPSGRGAIEILFDTSDKPGVQNKNVDVIFRNVDWRGYPLVKQLVIRGDVQ